MSQNRQFSILLIIIALLILYLIDINSFSATFNILIYLILILNLIFPNNIFNVEYNIINTYDLFFPLNDNDWPSYGSHYSASGYKKISNALNNSL